MRSTFTRSCSLQNVRSRMMQSYVRSTVTVTAAAASRSMPCVGSVANVRSHSMVRSAVSYNQPLVQHFSSVNHIETAVLDGTVDFAAPVFVENAKNTEELLKELNARLDKVQQGGGEKQLKLHRSRGKMTARERIAALADPGSPFVELSPLAGWDMYDGDCLSGGIVTGIGRVDGIEVMIVANDATVKGKLNYA